MVILILVTSVVHSWLQLIRHTLLNQQNGANQTLYLLSSCTHKFCFHFDYTTFHTKLYHSFYSYLCNRIWRLLWLFLTMIGPMIVNHTWWQSLSGGCFTWVATSNSLKSKSTERICSRMTDEIIRHPNKLLGSYWNRRHNPARSPLLGTHGHNLRM